MRIHDIIEACIDFIAVEGILGSDIDTLQAHLATLDPSIDLAYFTYIYSLLIPHPSIQVILTAHPLPPQNGIVRVGTAPVPADDITRNLSVETRETAEELAARGLKGRNLAFQLAGREFRSSKESVADKRLENFKNRKTKKKTNDSGTGDETVPEDLWSLVEEDDGCEGEDKVPRTDLARLLDKWGSRLRIRASDDEIYYRLVGTTNKNPRITPIVFHILQVTAKTRERGITTIDLGPAVGAGQGSLHYYMKVLTGLGLCAKLPTVSFSAMTNILVFHKFMEQNTTYQALMQPIKLSSAPEPQQVQDEEIDPALLAIGADPTAMSETDGGGSTGEPSKVDPLPNTEDWGLEFTPLTEMDLMTGTVVKDRLLQILEHPNLKNHLLKLRELLPALGWRDVSVQRHKRAFSKHVDSLIFSGIVEKVLVGEQKTGCLRLVKYNPDFVANPAGPSTLAAATMDDDLLDPAIAESDLATGYNDLFTFTGSASMATHLEYQVLKLVVDSAEKGMIIADLRDELSTYYKRSIEFLQIRLDNAVNPPHLRHMNTTSTMENFGRERRLRCFSVTAMRNVWIAQGQTLDDTLHPPAPPEAGHWQDVSFRKMWAVPEELHKMVDKILSGQSRISAVPGGPVRRVRGPNKRTQLKHSTSVIPRDPDDPALKQSRSKSPEKRRRADSPSQRTMKYRIDGQVRGRPRKYIHVVTETGKIHRTIIGQKYPHPELAPIYVYLTNLNKLVIPPAWYSGLGKPPELDAAAIADGKLPSYFDGFPGDKHRKHRNRTDTGPKKKKKKKKPAEQVEGVEGAESGPTPKKKSKGKAKASGADGANNVTEGGEKADGVGGDLSIGEGAVKAPPKKRKKKDVEGSPGTPSTAEPKAKKAKKNKAAPKAPDTVVGQHPMLPTTASDLPPNLDSTPPPPSRPVEADRDFDTSIDPFIGEVLLPALRNAQAHNAPPPFPPHYGPIHPPMLPSGFYGPPRPYPPPPPHGYPGYSPLPQGRPPPGPPPHVYPPFQPPPLQFFPAPFPPPEAFPRSMPPGAVRPPVWSAFGPRPPPHVEPGPSRPAATPKRKKKDSEIDPAILGSDGLPEKKKRGRPLGSKTKPKPKPPAVEGELSPALSTSKNDKQTAATTSMIATPNPVASNPETTSASKAPEANTVSAPVPSTLAVPPLTPAARSPSPMIGSDFPEDKPIFSIPPDSEPREQHFLLPQVIRSYRNRVERRTASGVEDGLDETPGSDQDSVVPTESAHPSPSPLARQLSPMEERSVQRREGPPINDMSSSLPVKDGAVVDDGPVDTSMDDYSALPDPIEAVSGTVVSPVFQTAAPLPSDSAGKSLPAAVPTAAAEPATVGMAKRIADRARQAFNTNGSLSSTQAYAPTPPNASLTAISPQYTTPSPSPLSPPTANTTAAAATPSPAPSGPITRVEPAAKMRFKPSAPRPRQSTTTPSTPTAAPTTVPTPSPRTTAREASMLPGSIPLPTGPTVPANGMPPPPHASMSPEKPTFSRFGSTPLREVTPAASTSEPRLGARGPVRLDLQQVRRGNEICEALRDAGGVLGNHKLRYHHNEWALRVAGTEVPFAPNVGYLMDRSTFTRTITQLEGDGRVKETTTAIPTLTGRYVSQNIIYLSETPWESVQAYIRGQGEQVKEALTPRKKAAQTIAATDFSVLRTPDDASTLKGKFTPRVGSALKEQSTNSPLRNEVQSDMPPGQRRGALLQDREIVGALCGHQPSRNVRCHILHRAIVKALQNPSDSIMSTAPRVFALPFLMEDLAAADWFSVIRVGIYSQELERFLLDPQNRDVKMRDLPSNVKPPEKVAGHGSKSKFRSLLDGLTALKIIEPLVIGDEANHSFTCDDKQLGGKMYFRSEVAANATYFRVYDFVPLFHFGGEVASLLAVLPIKEEAQVDNFWDVLQKVSLTKDVNKLPRVQGGGRVDSSNAATFSEVGDIDERQRQALTRRRQWNADVSMHAVQSEALDKWTQGHLIAAPGDEQELDQLAWEYAIPRAEAGTYILKHRESLVKRRTQQETKVAKVKAVKMSAKERREVAQKRAEEELKQKLAERAAKQKAEWEARVRAAAGRTKTPFSEDLVRFVGRHAVQTSTINPTGTLTDAALDEACRIFMRNKAIGSGAAPGQAKPIKAPRTKAPPKAPKVSAAQKKKAERAAARENLIRTQPEAFPHVTPIAADVAPGSAGPKRRRRKVWTHEDEEDLLDCEAILRARSRDIVNAKGRLATERIISNVGHQTLLVKLKAQMKMPGKKAYFERLTDAWYDIWKLYRGTPELPDHNWNSITDFDIRKHLDFLRARIHKPSIRLAAAANPIKKTIVKVDDLPNTIEELYSENQWIYQDAPDPNYEILWNPLGGDDVRLTTLSSVSTIHDTSPWLQDDKFNRRMGKLRTITKMIVAVPTERYHQPTARVLLSDYMGREVVQISDDLCSDKVLRKTSNLVENKRQFAFQKEWLNAREGLFPEEFYAETAVMMERLDPSRGSLDWSLLALGGEVAAVLDAVSRDEVDFSFDIHKFPTVSLDPENYNTRRFNDIDFEFELQIHPRETTARPHEPALPSPLEVRPPQQWSVTPPVTPSLQQLKPRMVSLIRAAGEDGISSYDLMSNLQVDLKSLYECFALLARDPAPLAFWAGYDIPRLVAWSHRDAWKVQTNRAEIGVDGSIQPIEGGQRSVLPRQWIDIFGERMEDDFRKICMGVTTLVNVRAGISETALREKLALTLDRLEANDVFQYLLDKGTCRRQRFVSDGLPLPPVEVVYEKEGELIAWYPVTGLCWQ